MPKDTSIKKILVVGAGPIVIGQGCEFDYSGTQACKALKALGYEIVLVNSNPATIMTDPEMADITYIEPLNVETMEKRDYMPTYFIAETLKYFYLVFQDNPEVNINDYVFSTEAHNFKKELFDPEEVKLRLGIRN